jgi:Flp pilus assembly protein TadG
MLKDYDLVRMKRHNNGGLHRMERRSPEHRRGSVILAVAFGLTVLCGFCALAVDYGRSVLVKNQLQRACDAGALAGVKYLPTDSVGAKASAVYYAYQNNKVTVDSAAIQITNNARIRVPATQNVNYLFAPVMKIINGNVPAKATAAVQLRDNFLPPYVVPVGITPSTYETYKDGTEVNIEGIRQNKQDLDIREFVLFDLRSQNSKSPSHMQGQLQWGSTFNEPTVIGGTETTLNAANNAQTKFFQDGMQSRFTAAANSPWFDDGTKFTNIPSGSPRMMYFIVTPESQPVNGNNNATVIAFAPVYVESITISGSYMSMKVRFLPLISIGGGGYTDVTSNNPDNASFRIYRLVD